MTRPEPAPALLSRSKALAHYWSHGRSAWVFTVGIGDYAVGVGTDCVLRAVLGSCVSACVWEPTRGIGGMNHFLLPEREDDEAEPYPLTTSSIRYGVYAMEVLINEMMKAGCARRSLTTRVFGGASVLPGRFDVGRRNIEFVRAYLEREGLNVAGEDVGGHQPRRVEFKAGSGRIRVTRLESTSPSLIRAETRFSTTTPLGGEVDLF